MASWLEHPRYLRQREDLIKHLKPPKYRFRSLSPVIFLCGGNGSDSRDAIRGYLAKYHSNAKVFYAEKVWETIAALGETDALQMEADLADLAEIVLIVVESPGTFTELGAFSISRPLRKKLLPVVDSEFRHVDSFISNGPLKWIDKESDYGPTIYVKLKDVLLAATDLDERLRRLPRQRRTKLEDLSTSKKHLLFFICDLVSIIYPAPLALIQSYLYQISPSLASSGIKISTLLGLAVAMGLLQRVVLDEERGAESYYLPTCLVDPSRPFQRSPFFYLEGQRASYTSVLMTFPEARELLRKASAVRC